MKFSKLTQVTSRSCPTCTLLLKAMNKYTTNRPVANRPKLNCDRLGLLGKHVSALPSSKRQPCSEV